MTSLLLQPMRHRTLALGSALAALLPGRLVLTTLLASTLLPSAASAHRLTDFRPGNGPNAAAARGLRPSDTEAADGNRGVVTLHSAAGQDAPLRPLAAGLVDALQVSETDPGQAAAIRAEQAWARATAPQQKVGGAYVTLISPGDDRLVGVSSPVAGRAEVHEMRMDGNVMRMREVEGGLALPAGKVVALAPGGYHIMLMELKQPLVAGQVIPMQLRFRSAPPLDLQVRVAPVGASAPPGAGASASSGHVH